MHKVIPTLLLKLQASLETTAFLKHCADLWYLYISSVFRCDDLHHWCSENRKHITFEQIFLNAELYTTAKGTLGSCVKVSLCSKSETSACLKYRQKCSLTAWYISYQCPNGGHLHLWNSHTQRRKEMFLFQNSDLITIDRHRQSIDIRESYGHMVPFIVGNCFVDINLVEVDIAGLQTEGH